jgi:3-oxoadipate enol-lactonase
MSRGIVRSRADDEEEGSVASGVVAAGGGLLWYEEAGTGPAVLLLHAGGADSRLWDDQWKPLSAAYRVIRIDLPGAGRSPVPERPVAPNALLEDLLDRLGVDRVAVVGVSLGGVLAVDFAIEHPERTWALVAVASGPRGAAEAPPEHPVREVWRAVDAGDLGRAAELFVDLWCPLRTSPELDRRMRRMVEENVGMLTVIDNGLFVEPEWPAVERLGEIRVPTLAIWGDADEPVTAQLGELLAARVPGARRVVLDGVDHFVPMRAPERFGVELLAFLGRARGG